MTTVDLTPVILKLLDLTPKPWFDTLGRPLASVHGGQAVMAAEHK